MATLTHLASRTRHNLRIYAVVISPAFGREKPANPVEIEFKLFKKREIRNSEYCIQDRIKRSAEIGREKDQSE